jgi:Cu+-exporting ATPase
MTSPTDLRTLELDIEGMTCASCAMRVERTLNRIPGVQANVNFATERAVVHLPPTVSTQEAIATVEKTGYGAREHSAHSEWGMDTRLTRRRLLVSLVLTIPIVVMAMVMPLQFPGWQWVSLVLAIPVVTWCAWPFHRATLINLRHGALSMDTLVSLGITAAFLWSLYALIWGGAGAIGMTMSFHFFGSSGMPEVYFEVAAAVTTFLLLGRYWEARAKDRGGQALRELARLGAREATVITDAGEERVAAEVLRVGDLVRVKPGEKVPADGIVRAGHADVDMSFVTGESLPVDVGPGDGVVGASIVGAGSLDVELTAVGEATQIAQMSRLLHDAQSQKAPVQRLADRISAVFVPIVVGLALLTLAGWLIAGADANAAFTAAIAVLIIACPCALGLATPTALLVGTGRGAQLGILIRGPQVLEATRRITTIVLDKTGTVTEGRMVVDRVHILGDFDDTRVRLYAASVESRSEHPVAQAIAALTEEHRPVLDFAVSAGGGVRGVIDGRVVMAGKPGWLAEQGIIVRDLPEGGDATRVGVSIEGQVAAIIEVADRPRADSARAVAALRALGLTSILLTGDRIRTAEVIADEVGIGTVIADATPDAKLAAIVELQSQGQVVAMAGDGINDAIGLAQADLGIAMGSGTDLAREASDITVMRPSLMGVVDAIRLSRRTLAIIKGNLFWAFAYNVAAIPLAMAGLLNPMIAGAAMAFSSVFVLTNSLRLRSFAPTP